MDWLLYTRKSTPPSSDMSGGDDVGGESGPEGPHKEGSEWPSLNTR